MNTAPEGTASFDLSSTTVAVLGCGSVGSFAAWLLASRGAVGGGIGRIVLADKDVLSADNVRRHACGPPSVGRPKVAALEELLADRYPSLAIDCQELDFVEQPLALRAILSEADLALVSLDNEGAKYLIDSIAWELGIPAIYAGVYGGGWGIEAVLVDPTRNTPCYGCAAHALGRAGIEISGLPEPAYARPIPSLPMASWPQADLTSIVPAAALAARLALARLEAECGNDAHLQDLCCDGCSAWRLPLGDAPALVGKPWQLTSVPAARQSDCPTCSPAARQLVPFWPET